MGVSDRAGRGSLGNLSRLTQSQSPVVSMSPPTLVETQTSFRDNGNGEWGIRQKLNRTLNEILKLNDDHSLCQ